MIITHKLQSMDLAHKQNTSRVDVVQDDKYSRDVEFTLTSNGVAWQIPDGTTAIVRYKKPDGTGGNYDTLPDGSTAYQINGNVLTVSLAPQVCTVSGSVQLSVGLIKGNAEINTFSVNIVVHPNPGAEYQSEDYIRLSGAVPNSGWTPNMYLGTDASGNVVAKEGTSGGGGTSGKDGVGIQSVEQTTTSTEDGGTNIVTVAKTDGTSSTFQVKNGSKGSTGPKGTDGKSAYQYAQEGGYTGTETEFAAKMAKEMPTTLPNPNAITFTGAVTGSYDGSEPLTVNIPSSGGGSGGSDALKAGYTLIMAETLAESSAINITDDGTYNEILIFIVCPSGEAISFSKFTGVLGWGNRLNNTNIALASGNKRGFWGHFFRVQRDNDKSVVAGEYADATLTNSTTDVFNTATNIKILHPITSDAELSGVLFSSSVALPAGSVIQILGR